MTTGHPATRDTARARPASPKMPQQLFVSYPPRGRGIFISYRRDNDHFFARLLHDNLRDHFGRDQVFVDVDGIDPGDDFAKVIDQRLSQSSVVLVIIGKNWTNVADSDGRRRLENPDDFVRIEVEKALARDDVRVIPIYVDGASPPDESALPGPLKALARRNGIKISNENFNAEFERLVDVLERVISAEPEEPQQSVEAPADRKTPPVPPILPMPTPARVPRFQQLKRRFQQLKRRPRIVLGAVTVVAAVAAVVAYLLWPGPGILLSDEEINAIMGASDMKTVEHGKRLKPSRSQLAEVSPPECMGALYPGLDQTYQGSGVEAAVTWKVLEGPPGSGRAGDGNHHFVDQTVATFPHNTDRALAFVRASADQWRACTGKTVPVKYTRHPDSKYTWTIENFAWNAAPITLSYSQKGGHGYACQRVLNAVSNIAIDVKACGDHITNEAGRIVDKLADSVSLGPEF